MSVNFDARKIQKTAEKLVEKQYWEAIERAKRSLGADGPLVKIKKLPTPHRQGSKVTYGDMSFPS